MIPNSAPPVTLRVSRRTVVSGLVAAAAATTLNVRPAQAEPLDLTAMVIQRLNDARIANGLPGLPEDPHLSTVSAGWSAQMAGSGGLSHNPRSAAQYGLPLDASGEIVGYIRDEQLSQEQHAALVVDLWMDSPTHRPVILQSTFTDVGVGVAWDSRGGMYATANFVNASLPCLAQEALAFSQSLVATGSATRIVIAHSELAADALAGSSLADGNSPILFARPDQPLPETLTAEIGRIAAADANVYLIGGRVSDAVGAQVTASGATPVRLDGASRYDTAARVAREIADVRGQPDRIYIARADEWADAVTIAGQAALHGHPVVLVDPDRVPPETLAVLQQFKGAERVVMGGSEAVSDAVANQIGASRLAGPDRSATGAVVMRQVWGRRKAATGEHLVVTPGWSGDGWAAALAHSLYSARHHAPLLFVDDVGAPPAVRDLLTTMGYTAGTAPTITFARRVSAAARADIEALTGH